MREIEIKLRVRDLEPIERELIKRGCQLSSPIRQHDTIYSKEGSSGEWESSKEGDIVLRIRRQEGRAEFNLKQQRSSELDNIEYETEIESAENMHQILLVLGWIPQVEVKKVRRKGKLGEYEICLDEVEELGSFVELEKIVSNDTDPTQTQEELFQISESLGLSRNALEVRGYDTQLFFLHRNKYRSKNREG